jgi:tetratricopeptide (TPR) repeat protein
MNNQIFLRSFTPGLAILGSLVLIVAPDISTTSFPRTIEPRLAADPEWAPCRRSPVEARLVPMAQCGPRDVETLRRMRVPSSRGQRSNSTTISTRPRAALAVAYGHPARLEKAIESLSSEIAAHPRDAGLLNDLAVAYYLRAQALDRPYDLVRALSFTLEAGLLDPQSRIVAFNRALFATRLHLDADARRAWRHYLSIDSGSSWAQEARAELAALEMLPIPVRWSQRLDELPGAARRESDLDLEALVAISPQRSREWVLEELLPSWAASVGQGFGASEEWKVRVARSIGRSLAGRGEHSVAAAIVAIDAARANRDDARLRLIAEGLALYGTGRRLDRDYAAEEAAPILERSIAALRAARSPSAAWAEASLASTEITRSIFDSASARLTRLQIEARGGHWPALVGTTEWGLGQILVRGGDFAEGLPHFLRAAEHFREIGELENWGGAEDMAAEAYKLLGNRDRQWALEFRALSKLRFFPASRRLHNLFWDVGETATLDGQPALAQLFHDEGVAVARRSGNTEMIVVALARRARSLERLGRTREARAGLDEAARWLPAIHGTGLSERMRRQVQLTEAVILRGERPREAVELFAEVADGYAREEKPIQQMEALLDRARTQRLLQDAVGAEKTVDQAIEILERERDRIPEVALASSHADLMAHLYDLKVSLLVERDASEEALAIADQARSIRRPENDAAGKTWRELPADVTLLAHSIVDADLLIWMAQDGRLELTRRPLGDLEEKVSLFLGRLERGLDADDLSRVLFERLLPPNLRPTPSGPSRLLIVGDKFLHRLPFAALQDPVGKRYLVEDFLIASAPSLEAYLQIAGRSRGRTESMGSTLLAGSADWDRALYPNLATLRYEKAELEAVAGVSKRYRMLVGGDATPSRLMALLAEFDTFHFAGHAIKNAHRPFQSHLVLTADRESTGLLTAREIGTLQLENLRLVVLSACDTLTPHPTRTGSFAGLGQAFLAAGAQSVVGSLWKVDDEATMRFMERFYQLYGHHSEVAASLRAAQLIYLSSNDSTMSRPSTWAAFQASGLF